MPPSGPVWLVIPTYNEAGNLRRVVAGAREALAPGSRVLVVDDASPDGTGELADGLAAGDPAIEVLHRPRKEGLGPAYRAGFRRALAEGAGAVLQMDADLSHDPCAIAELLAALEEADLALGSRYVAGGRIENWGPLRRAVSRGGSAYARAVLGLSVRDLTGGFKAWRREALEAIRLEEVDSLGYAFQVETTYRAIRAGLRVVEVPIRFCERREGASKMSRRIVWEAAWRVPLLRFGGGRIGPLL